MALASPSPSLSIGAASHQILVPDSWLEAAQSIAFGPRPPLSHPPATLVCGPKNSGKSTFSRFLVNTLLQRYKDIAFLDTDVGQPEFTPPGFISLHVLKEQFSGTVAIAGGVRTLSWLADSGASSNVTRDATLFSFRPSIALVHAKEADGALPSCLLWSLFYGDISSKRDPKVYLNCIFRIYDYFLNEFYRSDDRESPRKNMLPLVINTPGWVKGVGFELLVEMVKYICPNHVVQLRISAESKNLPSGAFWLDPGHESSTNVIEIYAARKDCFNRSVLVQKQAHSLRDIRIMAYFQQCIPLDMNVQTSKELAHALCSVTPYEVPFSGIKVKHLYCQVPESEIFHSLNATIVGLAVSSEGSRDTECWASWCVGLGIVRGIDTSRDLLYIITPVSPSSLAKVNLLMQGFIEIPTSLLQVRSCTSPYMSRNVLNKLDPYGDLVVGT